MGKIIQLAFRGIRASLGRLILTTVAIVAGVGFVAGSFILADSLSDTFNRLFEQAASTTDAQITVAELDFGTDERTIPDTLTAEVEELPEVGEAFPSVEYDANTSAFPFVLLDADGEEVKPPTGAPVISFSWDGEELEDSLTIESGTPPMAIDELAIDSAYADAADVTVGDTVTVLTPDGRSDFEVTSVLDFAISGGAYFVLFDFESAQTLYGKEGQVDAISLTRATGVSTDDMIAAVAEVIPEEAEVIDQSDVIEQSSADFEQIIGILRNALLAFAGIALFVSLFIIYNTFAILVNQRLQQIGMLRAIGATKGQIRLSVMVEAVIVGVVGSLVGLAFGLVVAFMIKSGFQAAGGFPETNTVVRPRTVLVALIVGVGATLVSALIPALLAGRVTPIAAMRNEAPSRGSLTRRTVIGAAVVAIGLIVLAIGLFVGGQETTMVLTELAVGVILTFIGVALLSVLFAGPIVDLLGRPVVLGVILLGFGLALPLLTFTIGDGMPGGGLGMITFVVKMFVSAVAVIVGASILLSLVMKGRSVGLGGSAAGLPGRFARRNAARSPQRTAATATALTIGIALVSTVGVFGESLKATFSESLDQSIRADLFIIDDQSFSAFSGELANSIEEIDGIAALSRFRTNEIRLGGPGDGDDDVAAVTAYNASTEEDLMRFDVSSGSIEGLLGDGILVFADEAEDRGLAVGDSVTVEFPDLVPLDLTVAGIFEDNSVLGTNWVVDIGLYSEHVTSDEDFILAASIADDADPVAVKAEVAAAADEYSSVTVQDTQEFQEGQEGQVDTLITLINLLLTFALVVAFLGVINTIVLSVIERTREIGLLRAVGMTRRQIRSTIRWESVIVSLFGAVLGIVLGVLFGWAAVSAVPDGIISNVAVPYETVLFAILVAALAGVVAATLPARRAAKLDPLEAIATGE